jgi:hypothetical protein
MPLSSTHLVDRYDWERNHHDHTTNFRHIRSFVLLDRMSPSANWSAVASPRSGRLQQLP